MQVASWNVNSLRVRLPQLADWLAAHPVDVIGLQETKLTDELFPQAQIEALGYQVIRCGQKTYNGVALLSRLPLSAACPNIPGFHDEQRRVIAATSGGIRYVNVYIPNGQSPLSDKYTYKLGWLAALSGYLRAELAAHERLIVMGDFNIAPDDRDVHDPAAWAGGVMVSEPERAGLRGLLGLGLSDTFRLFEQPPQIFSWWDFRTNGFRRNHGVRIDLVLASKALADACRSSSVDYEPRRNERPSDHAPVLASFDI
jgi:exodeoxyribonuclease III